MTINYNNWGLINSSADLYNNWTAYPVLGMCRRWSDQDEDLEHRVRVRAHVDTDSSNNGTVKVDPDDGNPANSLSFATGNHSDDWTSTWENAEDSPQHLTGQVTEMSVADVTSRLTACRIRFRRDAGSPVLNSVEIGAPYDLDYDFDDDLTAQEFSQSGATRLYLDYDAASSWMMTDILGHTYNRITYGATWRMSFPVCGARE